MADTERFQNPGKECDLVMKGGVASGIVYPQAILTLAEKYRFRSIGGTSAGAIAAALAAAAEYGRETGGFDELERVRSDLVTRPDAIYELFQPTLSTRPLWDTIWGMDDLPLPPRYPEDQPKPNAMVRVLRMTWWLLRVLGKALRVLSRTVMRPFFTGAAIGLVLGVLGGIATGLVIALVVAVIRGSVAAHFLALAQPLGITCTIPGLIVGICAGGLIGAGYKLVRIIWRDMPANGFGICAGNTVEEKTPGLTDWLSEKINRCAGKDAHGAPLTFGDLKAKQHEGRSVAIDLRAVTTNLSQGRPWIFPLTEERFVCRRDVMRGLFPENVCRYMERLPMSERDLTLPEGYYYLPAGNDLPVIVAARLSLSLPLVLTAVPLFTIREDAYARARAGGEASALTSNDLQENWFTDGGISSNFPIHLFDSWFPTRPTFGIRLTALTEDMADPASNGIRRSHLIAKLGNENTASPQPREQNPPCYDPDPATQVYLPPARAVVPEEWAEVTGIPAFLTAIFNTARNYHDNTQSTLASYRERIAQVRLSPRQGGINLRLPRDILNEMNALGHETAKAFIAFYGDPDNPQQYPDTRFQEHRWVRMRVLAAQLEQQFNRVGTAFTHLYHVKHPGMPLPDSGVEPFIEKEYADLLDKEAAYAATDASWYASRDRAWCDDAQERLIDLFTFMDGWSAADIVDAPPGWPPFFSDASTPTPSGILRVTPEL
jgi:predicted acylesterase/phospholipase RssA